MRPAEDPRWVAAVEVLGRLAPGSPPTVVRDGAALLVRAGDVVVRSRASGGAAVARREVAAAQVLAAAGVPATDLVGTEAQPIATGGAVVTAWRWVDHATGHPSAAQLGALVRRLRAGTSPPPPGIAPFDPFAAVADALGVVPDGPERRWLVEQVATLSAPWAEAVASDPAGAALVHGDLHRDNVLVGPDGPRLADLELSGVGPPSYDLVPTAVAVTRYGADPVDVDALIAAAGWDPRSWPGWATCCAVYELWVTAWAVGGGVRDPALAAEGSRRVATLRDGADHRWHLR